MSKSNKIYLDSAAGVSPNSGSIHALGVDANRKLQNSRERVAGVLGARPGEIIFSSGGTESNNLAIQGIVFARHLGKNDKKKEEGLPHIVTTNIEHPSILETCKLLAERKLAQITVVPVETTGIVDPKKIKKALKKSTVLVSVNYANNEIGTIQPIREIAKEIRHYRKNKKGRDTFWEHGFFSGEKFPVRGSAERQTTRSQVSQKVSLPFFHTDAVQAANYLDLKVEKLGVDLLTLSGSKIDGAGRVGVLYKKKSVPLANIFGGGDQEWGLRPGTENLPEIMKFSDALEVAQKIKEKEAKRMIILRDYLMKKLSGPSLKGRFILNGELKNRLPNNMNISVLKIPSELLVIELSAKGIMASAKSACESSRAGGSYVINAIRPNQEPSQGGVRFSLGRQTTKKHIDYTANALVEIVNKLKKWYK